MAWFALPLADEGRRDSERPSTLAAVTIAAAELLPRRGLLRGRLRLLALPGSRFTKPLPPAIRSGLVASRVLRLRSGILEGLSALRTSAETAIVASHGRIRRGRRLPAGSPKAPPSAVTSLVLGRLG